MTTQPAPPNTDAPHTWTVAEAKARLSEVLRLADAEGPQRIGVQRAFIVVPERLWQEQAQPKPPRKPLGQWLVENMPRVGELEIPPPPPEREPPFADKTDA